MFNVQSKTDRKSVWSTARTKLKGNGKTEKKAIEQSVVRNSSPMEGVGSMAGRI